MTAPVVPVHPAAVADDRVLFQVAHPIDMDLDEWTQNYLRAVAIFTRFIRDYGQAHLHAVTLHAGQYDAECLQHLDNRGGTT